MVEAIVLEDHVVEVLVVGDGDEGIEVLEHCRLARDDINGRWGLDPKKALMGDDVKVARPAGLRSEEGRGGDDIRVVVVGGRIGGRGRWGGVGLLVGGEGEATKGGRGG